MQGTKWLKARVMRAVSEMETRNVELVYRFIQGLTGKGRREHDPEEQRYLPRVSELEYLYDQIGNLPFSLMCAAFDFGFEQGKRYEKARRAKE